MNRIFLILFVLSLPNWAQGQNYSIAMNDVDACLGDAVLMPVQGSNLDNIGAITLFISYQPENLQFDTLTISQGQLAGLIYNDVQDSTNSYSIGKIGISWSGFSPANLGNNTLFELQFTFTGQSTNLGFDSICEIADFDANILLVDYVGGSVNYSDTIIILSQPSNIDVLTTGTATFSVSATDVLSYTWQLAENGQWIDLSDGLNISGSLTNSLIITNPGLEWNDRYFRCKLSGCNLSVSDSARLQVLLDAEIIDGYEIGWQLFPNPANDILINTITFPPLSEYEISIYNLQGNVFDRLSEGVISKSTEQIQFSTKNYPPGFYILELNINYQGNIIHKLKRILITN